MVNTIDVVLLFALAAMSNALSASKLDYCYEKMIINELHVGKKTMVIALERGNVLPVAVRVRVEKVQNGAYLLSALLPKSTRTLSEATFATPGDMDFDPRYIIGSVRVTFVPGVPSDGVFRKDRKPRLRIQLFGCYDP